MVRVALPRIRIGVASGEGDRQLLCTGPVEHVGPEWTMAAIQPHPGTHREPGHIGDGGDAAAHGAKAHLAFPDIVKQGGTEHRAVGRDQPCPPHRLVRMTLIGRCLPPEQGPLRGPEEAGNVCLLRWGEGTGP